MESRQADGTMSGAAREIRLEGVSLLVAAGVLVGLLAGAFELGRRVERRRAAPSPAQAEAPPTLAPSGEAAPYEAAPTVFDAAGEAEPRRQARESLPSGEAPPVVPPAPLPEGPWTVQVFAGRDRAAADHVFRTLRSRGHPARLESSREGTTVLYRVRVGGYGSRESAEQVAERLRREGMTSTWVTSR